MSRSYAAMPNSSGCRLKRESTGFAVAAVSVQKPVILAQIDIR